MTLLNVPDNHVTSKCDGEITYDFNLTVFALGDKVRFTVNGVSTSWLGLDDDFIKRIQFEKLNKSLISQHLTMEIEIKNLLDEGAMHLGAEKYRKAIGCFDDVIYYDEMYGEALLLKSRVLFAQKHFVKALRHYKKAVNANGDLKDINYHKLLVKNANDERGNFPKIKRHIYNGDEHFAAGDFKKAIESYDMALADSSPFKSRILHKLLNKKAAALFELKSFDEAMECFERSLEVHKSDYAIFMKGRCRHELGLALDDSFISNLKITKRQQLCRAMILIEAEMYADAVRCIDDLLSVHFAEDELYFAALSSKVRAMDLLVE